MKAWLALHVKPQTEYLAAESLEGLEPFWPHRVTHDNRNRQIRRPWFPGYVFIRADWSDLAEKIRILRCSQLVHVLGADGKVWEIPDQEIESLRILAANGRIPVSMHTYLRQGERVKVISGPLKGIEGLVERAKSATVLVVQVEMLQRAVSVELDPDSIEAVARRALHAA